MTKSQSRVGLCPELASTYIEDIYIYTRHLSMPCSSLPQPKQENASQPCTFFTLSLQSGVQLYNSALWKSWEYPTQATSSSGSSRRTGALNFCPLAAVVTSIFSFGKLNNSVEMKFETLYKRPKPFFIHSNIVAIKTME